MKINAKHLSRGAIIAALYVVLCVLFRPISYGPIQLRISEALCVLPILMPEASLGLFAGCFISNLLGGTSVALLDMVLGSLTTLSAAILTRRIHNKSGNAVLSLLPPVLLNAIIVGTYVPFLYADPSMDATALIVLSSIVTVGIGEALVIYILGLPLCKCLQKSKIFKS
ncbi:MAG: QueT transporter family protein [Clostridia bacterium]